jgi:hypothetical protein
MIVRYFLWVPILNFSRTCSDFTGFKIFKRFRIFCLASDTAFFNWKLLFRHSRRWSCCCWFEKIGNSKLKLFESTFIIINYPLYKINTRCRWIVFVEIRGDYLRRVFRDTFPAGEEIFGFRSFGLDNDALDLLRVYKHVENLPMKLSEELVSW